MTGWKKWLFIGLGFGAGAAVVGAVIIGSLAWYSSRPRPWNTAGIRTAFSTELYSTDDDLNIRGLELEYTIDNNTPRDYTLSPDQPFFLEDHGALRTGMTGKYKISDPCFVPARNKVKCQITVPVEFDTSFSVDGFDVFDSANRYNIIFPKPSSRLM